MRHIQTPQIKSNWLYNDIQKDQRVFSKKIILPFDTSIPWPECTNEEKEQWEREHQPEEPNEPEVEEVE